HGIRDPLVTGVQTCALPICLELSEDARFERMLAGTCAQCAGEHAFEASVLRELKAKLRRIDVPQSLIAKIDAILSDPGLRKEERSEERRGGAEAGRRRGCDR